MIDKVAIRIFLVVIGSHIESQEQEKGAQSVITMKTRAKP